MLQAVGVVAVAAVFGAAAGLHIGNVPRLGAERAQAGGGVGRTRAYFHVEGLDNGAALVGPVLLQFEDDLLEGEHDGSMVGNLKTRHFTVFSGCLKCGMRIVCFC